MNKKKLNIILDTLYESEQQLLVDGVIRTTNIVGELGEYYAAITYGLERTDSSCQKHVDLLDKNGIGYQVKTRRLFNHDCRSSNPNGRIGGLNEGNCDVIAVELDEKYRLKAICSVSRNVVTKLLNGKKHVYLKNLQGVADDPLKKI